MALIVLMTIVMSLVVMIVLITSIVAVILAAMLAVAQIMAARNMKKSRLILFQLFFLLDLLKDPGHFIGA
jgi:hypothetical protein